MNIKFQQNSIIVRISLIGGGQTKGANPYPEPFWLVSSLCFDWINNCIPHRKASGGNLPDRLGNILGENFSFAILCCKFFEYLKGGFYE